MMPLRTALLLALPLGACAPNSDGGPPPPPPDSARAAAFLDTLEERTFHYFWDLTNTQNGLTPDRAPSQSFSSIAAVGFALTAYPIGVERGYITRAQAAQRTITTLRFFWTAPQDSTISGSTGYHGFFYHFLDMSSGLRFQNVELSTIDTSLLLAGILLAQSYYDGPDPVEAEIRALADSIYFRVDWNWAQARQPAVSMGWHPEGGFIPADWIGYNEAMILYALALGSPTHALDSTAWNRWVSGYQWGTFRGQTYVQFGPLFGHEYSWPRHRLLRELAPRHVRAPRVCGRQPDGVDRLLEPDLGAHGLGRPGQHDPGAQRALAPVPHLLGARGLAVRVE